MVYRFTDSSSIFLIAPSDESGTQVSPTLSVKQLQKTAEDSLESLSAFANTIEQSIIRAVEKCDEIEVEFGLAFDPELKAFGVSISGISADLKVKIKIKPNS